MFIFRISKYEPKNDSNLSNGKEITPEKENQKEEKKYLKIKIDGELSRSMFEYLREYLKKKDIEYTLNENDDINEEDENMIKIIAINDTSLESYYSDDDKNSIYFIKINKNTNDSNIMSKINKIANEKRAFFYLFSLTNYLERNI
ncbi:MAG: hypothetical protein QXF12_07460 [Candidatus Aenigmatarchaeota archaeon]